jgi:UrcA family protein
LENLMKSYAILLAAAALTGAAFAADNSVAVEGMAPTRDDSFVLKRAMVQYGDLNITDANGITTLRTRIADASAAVCKNGSGMNSFSYKQKVERCQTRAQKDALKTVGLPETAVN